MPPILQPVKDADMPEFLTIGHVTRDLHPDGSFSLGGTVTFAALTTYRLGLVAAMVTRADSELLAETCCAARSPCPGTVTGTGTSLSTTPRGAHRSHAPRLAAPLGR